MYKIDKFCVYLGNVGLLFMVLSISADVIGRTTNTIMIPSIQQLDSEMVMNLIIWLGVSYVYLMDKHIRVDFIVNRFPKVLQTILYYVCNVGMIIYFALIGYYTGTRAIQSFTMHELSNNILAYPLWPLYILAPIGCLMIIIRIVQYTISKKGIDKFREEELKRQSINEDGTEVIEE